LNDELHIIESAKKDSKFFAPLYEHYFERIFRFIFKRLGGNEAQSADITQQTFIKAMVNIAQYQDRGLPFSSWLYRIAQNEVNMFFRSQKKTYSVEINDRMLGTLFNEAQITARMTDEEQEKLIQLLNGMNQEHLDLIELRFFQQLSFKEIAEIYSITEANAKMRVYRILEKLKTLWNN
jgi:RNA polymerase sigma-70 factor (ECF subfamily)